MTSALEPLWIGVDVGGTKVLAGVVDETGPASAVTDATAAYHPSCPPCPDPTPDWWAQ